jgi:hypothetical protein
MNLCVCDYEELERGVGADVNATMLFETLGCSSRRPHGRVPIFPWRNRSLVSIFFFMNQEKYILQVRSEFVTSPSSSRKVASFVSFRILSRPRGARLRQQSTFLDAWRAGDAGYEHV